MSQVDREVIAEKLFAFINELEPALHRGFGEEVAGSRAERLATGSFPSDSQGPYPGRNAMETALFATLAGVDHLRLFAHALVVGDVTFSLATLARGAIESFSRAWWLIESDSDDEMVLRWLSGLAAEMGYKAKKDPDQVLDELRGRSTTYGDARERVLDDIERLTGARTPRPVSYAAFASALIDRSNGNGREFYSHLSGVAHGESFGHHGFVEIQQNADLSENYVINLHETWGTVYANQVLAASSLTSRKVLALIGHGGSASDPLAIAHDDAANTLATMLARIRAEEQRRK